MSEQPKQPQKPHLTIEPAVSMGDHDAIPRQTADQGPEPQHPTLRAEIRTDHRPSAGTGGSCDR